MSIIIIGAGEVGYHLAYRLSQEKKDVVVIDRDLEKIRRVQNTLDVQAIQGSGVHQPSARSRDLRGQHDHRGHQQR